MENRQFNTQMAMKPVRNIRQVIGNVHTLVGGILLGIGALVFLLNFFFTHNAAVLSLMITGGTLAFSGIVELIIATFFLKSVRQDQANLERLKAEGHSFPGEIIKIQSHLHVRIGRSVSAYAECTYQNKDGKTCLVRSRSFLHKTETFFISPFDPALQDSPSHSNYAAWIYVNPFDPTDYAVEIVTQTPAVQADYDYR